MSLVGGTGRKALSMRGGPPPAWLDLPARYFPKGRDRDAETAALVQLGPLGSPFRKFSVFFRFFGSSGALLRSKTCLEVNFFDF